MAEEEIRAESRFGALVRATSDEIFRMSADWSDVRPLSGNTAAADPGTPAVCRAWVDEFVHPEDRAKAVDAIREAIATKGLFELEHRVVRKDGSVAWLLSRAAPFVTRRRSISSRRSGRYPLQ